VAGIDAQSQGTPEQHLGFLDMTKNLPSGSQVQRGIGMVRSQPQRSPKAVLCLSYMALRVVRHSEIVVRVGANRVEA
jgi:hypothetical protein